MPKIKRLGLLTLPLHNNYGGIIQAIALYSYLTKIGYDVIFLERTLQKSLFRHKIIKISSQLTFVGKIAAKIISSGNNSRLITKIRFLAKNIVRAQENLFHRQFIREKISNLSGPLSTSKELKKSVTNLKLDAIIVGSDQVWRLDYLPDGDKMDYFLGFAQDNVRKISYAASFGHSDWVYQEHTKKTIEFLRRFHSVSVRETSGVSICKNNLCRNDAQHVLDPTFLVDPSFYKEIAEKISIPNDSKIFLSYVLDNSPIQKNLISKIEKSLGKDYNLVSLGLKNEKSIDIPKWLKYFIAAEFVVTDSFHGTVFSIIFKKNFISLNNTGRGSDRFTSLLGSLGLSHRLISESNIETVDKLIFENIDYRVIDEKLSALKENSARFLRDALCDT